MDQTRNFQISSPPSVGDGFRTRMRERGRKDQLCQSVLSALSEGIVVQAASGEIIACNRAAEEILGRTFDQMCGRTSLDPRWSAIREDGSPFPGDEHPAMITLQTGEPCRRVIMGVRLPDASLRWISINSQPIFGDDDERPESVVTSFADITKESEASEALRRRHKELALLHRIVAAAVAEADPEEVAEIACRELAAAFALSRAFAFLITGRQAPRVITEYSAEPFDGDETQTDLFPALVGTLLERLVKERRPLTLGDSIDEAPDAFRSIAGSLVILPLLQGGEVIGGIGLVTREARELRSSELELARRVADQLTGALVRARLDRERRLLTIAVEQAGESVVITDTAGDIVYVNPTFERVTGYRREEILGENPRFLQSGEQDEADFRDLWTTISRGEIWIGRFVNRRKSGEIYTEEALISPVHDEDGELVSYVGLQRDVTEELEREEQHRRAQKMEAVGRLAGGVAHDFNNLLMAIMGHAELALAQVGDEHPSHRSLDVICHTAERAADLTARLLTFGRRRVEAPRLIDLNRLTIEMDEVFRRLLAEHVELKVDLEPKLRPVRADQAELEQVLVNLVVNASDAMPEGGHLEIQTRNSASGKAVELRVSDTGEGILPEVREKIFEPFFTTKEAGRGTGLGLATVYTVIEKYGGTIRFDSTVGKGTTFEITLPAQQAEPEPAPRRPVETESSQAFPRETLFLVEDDRSLRDVLSKMLQRNGYSVLEAGSGEEALERIEGLDAVPFDLLITDGIMPGMSGKDLAEDLSRRFADLKIIFMSGHTGHVLRSLDELPPGTVFLQKPVTPRELLAEIRRCLDGR